LEWYSKAGYDVINEKARCNVSNVVEGGHGFSPFGEVIDCDNNVFVAIAIWGVTSHEVNAPFTKGACSNNWVKKRGWCSCFVCVKLTFIASLHGMNEIMKQCRPKATCTDDFLSSGHHREMAPALVAMEIIQDSIGLVNSQASTEYGVNPSPI
jgi:hypothetical protein